MYFISSEKPCKTQYRIQEEKVNFTCMRKVILIGAVVGIDLISFSRYINRMNPVMFN